ncbi:MAG: efflux family protein [Clostridia bacterium]|nr:efflux family protein [Clostridia bacterium]
MLKKWIARDGVYLKTLLILTIPITLQNFLTSSLNFVDSIMVGKLGEVEISGVGLANQVFFVLSLLLFGICSGSSIFISQFWGSKELNNIKKSASLMLITASSVCFIGFIVAFLFPEQLIALFTDTNNPISAKIIDSGAKYLRIVSISYVPTAISTAMSTALRCIEKPRIPLLISFIAILTNTFLNYILIFGNYGFPKLGVEGAAIATVIARFIEVGFFITYVYLNKNGKTISVKIKDVKNLNKTFILNVFKVSIPVVLNESLWGLGVTMYSVVYGHMENPEKVLSVMNIQRIAEQLTSIITFSMAYSCGVLTGKKIGEGNEKEALQFAKKTNIYVFIISVICIGIIIILLNPLINQFNVSEEVKALAYTTILMFFIVMPFRASNCVNIVGTLRSGGDTIFCSLIDIIGVWCIGIPLCFLTGLVFKLPLPLVLLITLSDEYIKYIIVIIRLYSGKWINNLTKKV